MSKIAPKPGGLPTNLPRTLPKVADLPQTAPDGTIMVNAGKYARQSVLTAFEMIGGTPALAEWGAQNQEKFYTSLFAKTIGKDVEHSASDDVEKLLERLDAASKDDEEMTIDAEFEMVDGEYEDE